MAEGAALAARHEVTRRANGFVAAGMLTLEEVLTVLNMSRPTWYRRLEALREWESGVQPWKAVD